jgi:hypothetical protein
MIEENRAILEGLLASQMKLHYWCDDWQHGSISDDALRRFFEIVSNLSEQGGATVLETGAGLSTLVFLAAQTKRHIAIAPDEALKQRIDQQIERFFPGKPEYEFYADFSENVLPDLAKADEPYLDFALIDGGHGMPTVFVDFCYINSMLKPGGYLAVDDVQLYSARQLYLLLKNQPGFEIADSFGKPIIFRKTQDVRFLPDWEGQPFVVLNS